MTSAHTASVARPQIAAAPPFRPTGGVAADIDRPVLKDVLARLGTNLLVACAVPAALFYACLVTFDVWAAILAALGWSYGAIVCRSVTGRRTSGLLILTVSVMTARTALALATDSTLVYFLQPIISDGLVATAFLLSLATRRPVVSRLAGDFYPMDTELASRPRIRRLFWNLTLMWGLLCLAKASVTLWLLQSQSLETFVLAKSITMVSVNATAVGVTVCAAVVVARKEGLLPAGERRTVGRMPGDGCRERNYSVG